MRFGSLRIDIVRDANFRLDGGAMFGVVPKVLWERKFPADAQNRIAMATNCLLVRGRGFTVLIETGLGDKWDARGRQMYAIERPPSLPDSLAALGVLPDEVDAVVLSHLHFDHAGGATRLEAGGTAAPAFPNATLYVQAAELAHAREPHERDRASYHPADWEPYFADALPTTAHVPLPWVMAYDLYPVDLIENKRRLLAEAVREGWLCVFEHDPNVPWGRLVDEPNGKRRVHGTPAGADAFL